MSDVTEKNTRSYYLSEENIKWLEAVGKKETGSASFKLNLILDREREEYAKKSRQDIEKAS